MSRQVKVDVLVVGSGAAGLSAAVTAALHGASVLVAEKEPVIGGTSAWSGGWLWIPRNPLAREEGINEDEDAPLTYLNAEMDGRPADARLQTFLRYGPEMVDFFRSRTAVQFLSGSKMPDFHNSPVLPPAGVRSPHSLTMVEGWVTGCTVYAPHWRPSVWQAWGLRAARIWRIFSTRPVRRVLRSTPPDAFCATTGSVCVTDAGNIW